MPRRIARGPRIHAKNMITTRDVGADSTCVRVHGLNPRAHASAQGGWWLIYTNEATRNNDDDDDCNDNAATCEENWKSFFVKPPYSCICPNARFLNKGCSGH